MPHSPRPSTFSIVACDRAAGEWGVAVASKFLAVGAVVPWAQAGAGAIATQAAANTTFGPDGLGRLQAGEPASDILAQLLGADPEREHRQVGIVDLKGSAATFTGSDCYDWAGGTTGDGFAAQGNILTGADVVDQMAAEFERSSGALVDRLLSALAAGQRAGGDSRGQQSAALLLVRAGGGYSGFNDRLVDLRVDDHRTPIDELERLLAIHKLLMFTPAPDQIIPIDTIVAERIAAVLQGFGTPPIDGRPSWNPGTSRLLKALWNRENLENRWLEGDRIDQVALEYLERLYLRP